MGIVALIGAKSTLYFFFKPSKLMGSVFYFLGFFMIMIGWYMFVLLGFVSQMYGVFLLFRSFIKTIFAYCQTLPVIGPILRNSPFIHKLVNAIAEDSHQKKKAKMEV